MHRVFIIISIIAVIALSGCSKKDERKDSNVQQARSPILQGPIQPQSTPGTTEIPSQAKSKIIVPDDVKKRWRSVVLTVEDRDKKTSKDFTVKIGSEIDVPGSTLRVKTEEFLPDFRMDGSVKTSVSNEKNNPALRIKILERGKEVFEGWLFLKFPDVHSFEHPRYSIRLKDAI
ncbi:MAG: DUF2155 domain-containing protein [Nitrospirota bacterium]